MAQREGGREREREGGRERERAEGREGGKEEEEEEEEEEGLFKADAVNRREGGCRNAFKMYIV